MNNQKHPSPTHNRTIPATGRHPGSLIFPTHRLPLAILACFIVLALVYGVIVPPFENLDEVEHLGAIRYVAETGHLPTHGIPEAEVYHYRQEASQPPLYYILSAGLLRLLRIQTDDALDFWRFNSRVACGPGGVDLYDNRAIFYHDPNRERFPWHGTMLAVHILRVWSTLLQTVTVIGTYTLARLALPRRQRVALVTMAIVVFNPQFLLVASGINNDNLVTPLVTLGLCLLLRIWQDGLSVCRAIGIGLLTGLAGLSKLSGWVLLGLAGLVTLAMLIRSKKIQIRFVGTAILIPTMSLLVAGWWLWRNWQLYGDPTALQPMLELVGTRGESLIQPLLEAGWMFRSFWGQIPCSYYPSAFYAFYAVLTILSLGGLAWGWKQLSGTEQEMGIILGGWFLLIVVSWLRWDAMTPAPGGRLLFPALPAVALLMALGINRLAHGLKLVNQITIGLLALMAWGTASQILPGFFAPPVRYPDTDDIHPSHSLDAKLGESIQLRGYDVTLDDDKEPILDITMYWQTRTRIAEDYVMALQLVSPIPGDTTLRWNYNSWPGHGNYPTSAWQPGEIIADHYRFHLPEADFVTQAWDVRVALYEKETGHRLPSQIEKSNVGDHLTLARLRVPGRSPSCPENGQLTSEVSFGEAIVLTHAAVTFEQEGSHVELCWKALQSLSANYTVFVHLQDTSGAPIVTGDGPPMQGAFPTSMWHPGDTILDVHYLVSESENDEQGKYISIGLYKPEDGSRLPAYIGDIPVPDNAIQVWPDHP